MPLRPKNYESIGITNYQDYWFGMRKKKLLLALCARFRIQILLFKRVRRGDHFMRIGIRTKLTLTAYIHQNLGVPQPRRHTVHQCLVSLPRQKKYTYKYPRNVSCENLTYWRRIYRSFNWVHSTRHSSRLWLRVMHSSRISCSRLKTSRYASFPDDMRLWWLAVLRIYGNDINKRFT